MLQDFIKKHLSKDNPYAGIIVVLGVITVISIATNIRLANKIEDIKPMVRMQVDSSVFKIYQALKIATKPEKLVTAKLQHKGDFYYFEGEVAEHSFKINDRYEYDITYPNEIWDGYLTYVRAKNGGEYYMWSDHQMNILNQELNGWFLSDNLSIFQHTHIGDTAYLSVIYPIVHRRIILK